MKNGGGGPSAALLLHPRDFARFEDAERLVGAELDDRRRDRVVAEEEDPAQARPLRRRARPGDPVGIEQDVAVLWTAL